MALTVDQTAGLLRVTPERVRQLIRSGRLRAERFGRAWMVDDEDADRVAALVRPSGRPLGALAAWDEIERLERGAPRPAIDELRIAAARLRARSSSRRLRAHPSALGRMTEDPRLVEGGAAAAVSYGAPIVAIPPLDLYVRAGDDEAVVRRYRPGAGPPNVTLRVVDDDAWPFEEGCRVVGRVTALLDLIDANDRGVNEALMIWPAT